MRRGVVLDTRLVKKDHTGFVMHIDDNSMEKWERRIYGMIEHAGVGGKQLVENASRIILDNSREYVPADTFTLLNSGYYKVNERGLYEDDSSSRKARRRAYNLYEGIVGYGDDKSAGGVNPRTGIPASKYAWKVHEDLAMQHPNGGQAKFLERAFREYVQAEYGSELVEYEKSIYSGEKYRPVIMHSDRARWSNGEWARPTRKIRSTSDSSNLDRLSQLPKGASMGNSSWSSRKPKQSSGLHGYDPASANYRPVRSKKRRGYD